MHKFKQQKNGAADQSARNLLIAEYQNLVRWLHDDLGQNLVAIKSFAEAIIEQNKDSEGDTSELAEIIKQAANTAYRATYDLMQEVRAQDLADQTTSIALTTCLEDALLKENSVQYRLHIDAVCEDLDKFTRAVILRSVRTFINFSKQCKTPPSLSISLFHAKSQNFGNLVELSLVHQGTLDILPGDAPSLDALEKRTNAIGGALELETNNQDYLKLTLRLNFLDTESETNQ